MKVLMTTGGSGGHIFPALQVALQLKARGHQVIFAGALSMAQDKLRAAGFEVIHIPAQGLNSRSFIGIFQFAWAMLNALSLAVKTLRQIRPDKVIGFGGYGSFAVILAAWLLRYPSMIHEQNVVPGKANRLMSRFVRTIAISFKASSAYFAKARVVWTGCPCHSAEVTQSRFDLLKKFGLSSHDKVVLLLGGSQGSRRLNEVFYGLMRCDAKSMRIQAIHMTGQGEYESYRRQYQEHQLPVVAYPFISNIEEAYALADVVIARAGASTVCELGLLSKPAVLVPYPFAGNHQQFNAQVLTDLGAAVILKQQDLNEASLKQALERMMASAASDDLKKSLKEVFYQDAALRLALAVEEC